MNRLLPLAVFAGLLATGPARAQDRKLQPLDPSPPRPERSVFVVRNAEPTILAEVVGAHYKGDATLIAAPAGSGNAVLVSASPAVLPEVMKLLEQLDRAPRTVEVEVTVIEVSAKKDGPPLTEADLSPETLAKAGQGQRIKLTAVEGQPVSSTTGGNKPVVSSSTVAPGRGGFGGAGGGAPVVQRSVNYQPVGTTVKLTARVGTGDSVALDLSVQDSRVRPPEAGDDAGAASFENGTLSTKLSVPAGKPVVAQAVRTEGKAGPTVAVVLVTARVVEPGANQPK
ncbi:MAG TPA: secretin N-terminal domain-containing protein [Gemmata sp.]|nr:secretin N-terminal domain-containing protein [Gemmata sp.]